MATTKSTTTTEAAVLVGPKQFEVREFAVPATSDTDGLLEVESSGVCGSDLPVYVDGGGDAGWPRVIRTPVILGHENVGRIASVGREAAAAWKVAEGDRVVLERWLPCGRCPDCRSGSYARCLSQLDGEHLFYGGTSTDVAPGLWGGFARHMYLHPQTVMHRVDGSGDAEVFGLFMPLANAVSWVALTGEVKVGSSVLVEGPGPIGLMCALVAAMAGAQHVIVTGLERDADRLRLAKAIGATHTNASGDPAEVIELAREVTDGRGVDVVIDCTSTTSMSPFETAVEAVRVGGKVLLATQHTSTASESYERIFAKTLTVAAVRSRQRAAVDIALNLLTDSTWTDRMESLISPPVSLESVGDGFQQVLGGTSVHVAVTPKDHDAGT